MQLAPDGLPALPLWINGRAFLTVVSDFSEVTAASTGKPLRKLPLCGASEIAQALESAQSAAPNWAASTPETRQNLCATLSALLIKYREHFQKLLQEETGQSEHPAEAEIDAVISSLDHPSLATAAEAHPIILIADSPEVFGLPATQIVAALAGGNTVIARTAPEAPSTLFAFAELTARAGFPPGVLNLLHGEAATAKALLRLPK